MGLSRKKAIASVMLVVFAVTIAAAVTLAQASPPIDHPILAQLSEYYQIRLLPGSGDIAVPVGQPTYILHGWVTEPGPGLPDYPFWSEMTGQQKGEFLATANFELSIEGDPVMLRRLQWYDGSDKMTVVYYAVFPPGTLAVGNVITGYWSIDLDGTTYDYGVTRTVVVAP